MSELVAPQLTVDGPNRGDEYELVQRMKHGDDRAFAILYERYFDKLYGFIYKRVGHRQVAEDLLSHVFEKAFVHRASFEWKGTSFGAWLYRIATNTITDHWRAKKPTDDLEAAGEVVDASPLPDQHTEQRLHYEKLQLVLEQLPDRDRQVVTLKFYAEYGDLEIAKALGISANNVGVILHRALRKCRDLLPPDILPPADPLEERAPGSE